MNSPVTKGIEKLLTVQDLMDTLRISRPTLYRMLKAGQLKPVRIGKRTLFDPADIRGLIQKAKTGEKRGASPGGKARDRHSAAPARDKETSPAKGVQVPERSRKKPPDDDDRQGRLL